MDEFGRLELLFVLREAVGEEDQRTRECANGRARICFEEGVEPVRVGLSAGVARCLVEKLIGGAHAVRAPEIDPSEVCDALEQVLGRHDVADAAKLGSDRVDGMGCDGSGRDGALGAQACGVECEGPLQAAEPVDELGDLATRGAGLAKLPVQGAVAAGGQWSGAWWT
ncbi:hypothetical protein GALL_379330 [mine drainage metagenome]|uniref:Uncharacterized protein n=1 Tax=mine drainage metagenome TaxID=410659 RepID=A0A1J5QS52_9ZZZZ